MKQLSLHLLFAAIFLAGGLLFVTTCDSVVSAETTASSYSIDWYSMDGGGTMMEGGSGYTVSSTIGQPDTARSTGSNFAIQAGFWQPQTVSNKSQNLYLPSIVSP